MPVYLQKALTKAQNTYDDAVDAYNDAKAVYESTGKILESHKTALEALTSGQSKLVELSKTISEQRT